MEVRRYAPGDVLVRRGEQGDSLDLLADRMLKVRDDEHAAVRDRILPGDVVGEMSLLTGQPRSAAVVALLDSVTFEFRKPHLQALL